MAVFHTNRTIALVLLCVGLSLIAELPASAVCTLDVDGSAVNGGDGSGAYTDGLLIRRYLSGFTGTVLTNNAVDTVRCTRCTAATIIPYLNSCRSTMLEVDGNTSQSALTDGILTFRYMLGYTGTSLTSDAVGSGCTRCTADQIIPYLNSFRITQRAAGPVTGGATKKMASEWFSPGTAWPGWGPEGNGSYYYPTGFVAVDPHTSQDALFLFVHGGQTDGANAPILDPGYAFPQQSAHDMCPRDKAYLLIMPATQIGMQTDGIQPPIFTDQNTIWVSDNTCPQVGAGWGATSTPRGSNNDRLVLFHSDNGYTELAESPSSLGTNQYRTWINRRRLTEGKTAAGDQPIHFDLSPIATHETWTGQTLILREWEGLMRFQDFEGCPPEQQQTGCGALDFGRVKLRWSPTMYGSTDPYRVLMVDLDGVWHEIDPVLKQVSFEIKPYKNGVQTADIFLNEFGWFEAWFIHYPGGPIPPGCTLGSPEYRRGFPFPQPGAGLTYFRWWANEPTWSSGLAATQVDLTTGGAPWNPSRPGSVDYSTGREGAMRVNYNTKRWLFSAHNDTNICDPIVGDRQNASWTCPLHCPNPVRFTHPYQGLYVTVEELLAP